MMARRGKREAKRTSGLGKRLMSAFLASVMCVSMVQVGALAAGSTPAETKQATEQIKGETAPLYYTYETAAAKPDPNDENTEGTTTNLVTNGAPEGTPEVKVSKTIEATGTENVFDITLKVETNQKIETKATSPDASVVLILDLSDSMKGNRLATAKEKAIDFLENFVDGANGAKRMVSLVTFAKDGQIRDLGGSNTYWIEATSGDSDDEDHLNDALVTLINGLGTSQGTNIQAGVQLARNLYDTSNSYASPIGSIPNQFSVLLTDGNPTRKIKGEVSNTATSFEGQDGNYDPVNEAKTLDALVDSYAICFQTDKQSWMKTSGTDKTFDKVVKADNSDQLEATFDMIIERIKLAVDAWKVTDSIPADSYLKLVEVIDEGHDSDALEQCPEAGQSGDLVWNLREDLAGSATKIYAKDGKTELTPEQYKDYSDIATVVYELKYRVRLDTAASGFQEGKYYLTNGITELDYYLKDSDGNYLKDNGTAVGDTESALLTLFFKIPAVKGHLGDLSFTKVDKYSETGLADAEFELSHAGNCGCGAAIEKKTTESVDDGEVVFNNIPSGHTYTLTETAAPDNYVKGSKVYDVTVAYGRTVVTDGSTTVYNSSDSDNAMTVPNELDPKPTAFTIKKDWVGDTEAAAGITVTVKVYDSRNIGEDGEPETVADAVATLQITGAGSVTTGPLPTVDVQTGETIQYVVIEEKNANYEQVGYVKNVDDNTYTITNLKNKDKELTITKKWVGPDDYKTPVQVQIYQDGEPYGEAFSVTDTVKKTVPTYKKDGVTEYKYTVAELGLTNGKYVAEDGTTFSVAVSDMTITNTVDQQTISVTGNKTWNIASWPEGMDQPIATIALYANGKDVDVTTTVTAPATTYNFTELPKYALPGNKFAEIIGTDGDEIEYTVAEIETGSTEDLTITSSVAKNGKDFTNTLTGFTSVTVNKTWVDEDETTRPDTITINLLRNGVQYGDPVELKAKTTVIKGEPIVEEVTNPETLETEQQVVGYEEDTKIPPETSYTFAGLPKYDAAGKEYVYTVTEDSVSNYATTYKATVDGYEITNTLDGGEKTLTVSKVWNDAGVNHSEDTLSFGVYIEQEGDDTLYQTITLPTEEGAWTKTIPVELYDGGETLNYYVRELNTDADATPIEAEGTYDGKYTVTYADLDDTWTVTNTIQQDNTVEVSVEKLWNGGDDSVRPGVTVKLMKGKTQVATVDLPRVTEGEGEGDSATPVTSWSYTFTGLPKYDYADDGTVTVINYTIQEEMTGEDALIARYTERQTVTGSMAEGYTITNNFDAGETSVSGTKTWIAGGHSEEVMVGLYADGVKVASKETTGLAYSFDKLPVYNADGSKIAYTIYELDADDNAIAEGGVYGEKYTVTYTGNNITNKLSDLESTDISVPVNKIWNGPVPQDSGVTFTVTRESNGAKDEGWSDTITLTKDDAKEDNAKHWTGSLDGLEKYDENGYEYTYFVSEDDVDENGQIEVDGILYTSEAKEANTFVNTVVDPNNFSLSVEKLWVGSGDKNAMPAGITLQLLADGVKVDEVTLPKAYVAEGAEGDEWKHTFENKPVYDKNTHEEIVYTIKEVGETNGVIALHNNSQRYNVTYTAGDVGMTVTNELKDVDAYYYKVHRYYKSVINGVTTEYYDDDTAYTATDKGMLEINAMQWVDCATDDGSTTYQFIGDSTNVTQGTNGTYEFAVSDAGVVSFDVVKYDSASTNYYYDVYLNYEYTYTYSGGGGGGSNDTHLTVQKVWEGDTEETRPASIQVQLLRNGEAYGEAKTLNAANNWKATWRNLDDDFDWSVAEVSVPEGYTSSVTGSGTSWTITNTLIEEEIIEEEEPPMADLPEEEEIPEEDIPLADVPKTDSSMTMWLLTAVASGMGLVWLALTGKKREENT